MTDPEQERELADLEQFKADIQDKIVEMRAVWNVLSHGYCSDAGDCACSWCSVERALKDLEK